ncbi:uroporphyrinogen-III synthase [Caenimonas koreensis]|uniref:uroporphyrinogen-III synthase n=1 Tax=Caenimonas koreensis TaxID=367474 RepID=UPI002B26D404|nr:uroporphyrinogen-III synthase [Caenimonas koreensis]
MRLIVTRPRQEADQWVAQLVQRGVQAQALPLIEILPAADTTSVAQAWAALPGVRAVMFVSSNAVRHFFAHANANAAHWPPGTRAWATGPGTLKALRDAGVASDAIDAPSADAKQFDSETLWAQVASQVSSGDRVQIVRGAEAGQPQNQGRDWLEQQLAGADAVVTTVIAYQRGTPAWTPAEQASAAALAADCWLFSSSQAIANLRQLLPLQSWKQARAIATHARIAAAAQDAGFGVVCVSRPTVDAVVAALKSFR